MIPREWSCNNTGVLISVVDQSRSATAAASASSVVVGTNGASNTLFSVPNWWNSRAWSTVSSGGISVGKASRAIASVSLIVPNSWSRASYTLLSVRIVEGSCSVAFTFCLAGIKWKSRWAALAFSSSSIVVSIRAAWLALIDCSIPKIGSSTSNTLTSGVQERFVSRANTFPNISIKI